MSAKEIHSHFLLGYADDNVSW